MESETRPGAMVRVFRRIYLDLNLASRGGKRAQTTPNIPKSWGAEQKNPFSTVNGVCYSVQYIFLV